MRHSLQTCSHLTHTYMVLGDRLHTSPVYQLQHDRLPGRTGFQRCRCRTLLTKCKQACINIRSNKIAPFSWRGMRLGLCPSVDDEADADMQECTQAEKNCQSCSDMAAMYDKVA